MDETGNDEISAGDLLRMGVLLLACGPALLFGCYICFMDLERTLGKLAVDPWTDGLPHPMTLASLLPLLGSYALLRAIISRGRAVNRPLLACGILPAAFMLYLFHGFLLEFSRQDIQILGCGWSLVACLLVALYYLLRGSRTPGLQA